MVPHIELLNAIHFMTAKEDIVMQSLADNLDINVSKRERYKDTKNRLVPSGLTTKLFIVELHKLTLIYIVGIFTMKIVN